MRRERPAYTRLAIVGTGCRFPGAPGIDAFWQALVGNVDAVTPVPVERFDVGECYAPEPGTSGRTASRHGGFLDDPFAFDAAFFGISPTEARTMDPQQRLLLQVVWEALESAGIRPSSLGGASGAAARVCSWGRQATAEYADIDPNPSTPDVHGLSGATCAR